jgi:hypothetical protein
MGIPREQSLGAHQLSGRAESALRAVMLDECALQRIKLRTPRESFDRLHRPAVSPYGKIAARVNRLAIEQHGAGATLAAIASDFRSRHFEVIAEQLHQRPAIFHFDAPLRAVHHHTDRRPRHAVAWRVHGNSLRFERWDRRRDSEDRSGSLKELPAGNLFPVFDLAHGTFPARDFQLL